MFGKRIADIMPRLLGECVEPSCPPGADGVDLFNSIHFDWDDKFSMCEDADIRPCVVYLRGLHGLRIPSSWRPHLPECF